MIGSKTTALRVANDNGYSFVIIILCNGPELLDFGLKKRYRGFSDLVSQCETLWAGKLKTGLKTVVGSPIISV